MNTFLINTVLGMVIIMADTPEKAWLKYTLEETMLGDMFLDREDLLKRGYTKLELTPEKNVFELLK